ncbi:alkaline phosphatase family protein [Croceivirga sp. JEA036]|uniref:alkaline phosphatase family protein n=1 Tax=Croceivirga sp. JEA036 TaxID=2721162 RepID=UPI0014389271|nr:alkaline phosphatase family protein [Croceivirga sp. JEA036]NJB35612.1 sulfatase-like hydrolase/transferase [Croceivirga sp. JEA036]
MDVKAKIKKIRTLKHFTRLFIGYAFTLVILSIYQQVFLYRTGVLDTVFNNALYTLVLNHFGFAALVSFVLLFIYRFFESMRPGLGFKIATIVFSLLVFLETVLVIYFLKTHSLLNYMALDQGFSLTLSVGNLLRFFVLLIILIASYVLSYRVANALNPLIGYLYPFTFILFILFVGSIFLDKNVFNENKTQYLFANKLNELLDFNTYEGQAEYPLLQSTKRINSLNPYLKETAKAPNVVLVVIEGLSTEFTHKNASFGGFTPYLNKLREKSLYWTNFLSTTTEPAASIAQLTGSLPNGTNGLGRDPYNVNRNTLFSILKKQNYRTYFYYGGNTTTNGLQNYLKQEKVDVVLDKSRFGPNYKLQLEDGAGVSKGYPDGELYRKWASTYQTPNTSKLEVILNLSSGRPFIIPEQENYLKKIRVLKSKGQFDKKEKRFINSNSDYFAAMSYVDQKLKDFFSLMATTEGHQNTIYIVTGTSNAYIPSENVLEKYHVPLFITGPLVKKAMEFDALASHNDVTPTLLGFLEHQKHVNLPEQTAWMGSDLLSSNKEIGLHRFQSTTVEYIKNGKVYANGDVYHLKKHLSLVKDNSNALEIKQHFKHYLAVNKYVTQKDKLLPETITIYPADKNVFSKEDMLYVNSIFQGVNYDKAYESAKELAHNGNRKGALLMCNYILHKVPNHVDAIILKARIYSWNERFSESIELLEQVIDLHPQYQDGYAALLDTYFWSGNHDRAKVIADKLEENKIESPELMDKVMRCINQLKSLTQNSETPKATSA